VQWRTPITLAVLVAILLGAAYYGWQTVVNPGTDSAAPTTPTKSTHTKPPPPKQVCVERKTYPKGTHFGAGSFRVNVYNASSVSGRAGDVLSALHSRGFQLGIAANPPARVTAKNVTILTLTPTAPRVRLLEEQFKGVVKLVPGPALAVGIDVVLGPDFAGLAPDAPSDLTLTRATTVCVKFKTEQAG
jgi:hypothetical protein